MPKTRALLIDSNAIVRRDWLLSSAAWKVILLNAREGHFQLVVPKLVIQESTGRYRAALAEALEKRKAADTALIRLGVGATPPELTLDEQVARYEATLQAKVEGANGVTSRRVVSLREAALTLPQSVTTVTSRRVVSLREAALTLPQSVTTGDHVA